MWWCGFKCSALVCQILIFVMKTFLTQRLVEVGAQSVIKCTHLWLHECLVKRGGRFRMQECKIANMKCIIALHVSKLVQHDGCCGTSDECKLNHLYQISNKRYANVQLDGFVLGHTWHWRDIRKLNLAPAFLYCPDSRQSASIIMHSEPHRPHSIPATTSPHWFIHKFSFSHCLRLCCSFSFNFSHIKQHFFFTSLHDISSPIQL